MGKRRGLFLSILIIFSFNFYTLASQYPDVKIIQSNSNCLILEIKPEFSILKNIDVEGRQYKFLDFRNSISRGVKYRGYPDINFRNITIALPAINNNTIEILESDYEKIIGIDFLPVPEIKSMEDLSIEKKYIKKLERYGTNSFYPESLAELEKTDIARDRIIGNLVVFPLQYNPITRELKKYKRIVVKINFNGKNPQNIIKTALNKGDERNISGIIINDQESRSWCVRESGARVKSVNNSVLASGEWYKLEVNEEGMYKLDAPFFKNAKIDLSKVDPRTIKVFGNGGEENPLNLNAERIDDLKECAIYISGDTDGIFNENDYVLFYGKGANGWKYDSISHKLSHYIHHYSNSNYYFLTFGGTKGKRMQGYPSLNNTNAEKVQTLTGYSFIEPEINNLKESGTEWFGDRLSSDMKEFKYSTSKLDGLLNDKPVTYRARCVARSGAPSSFNLEQNGKPVGKVRVFYSVPMDDEEKSYAIYSELEEFNTTADTKDNKFNFNLIFNFNSKNDAGWLDWIEILYPRSLVTAIDEIYFYTPSANGIFEYNLSGFSSDEILAFDVSNHNEVKLISNSSISSGNIKIQFSASIKDPKKYYVNGNKGYKAVSSFEKIFNSNIHGISDGGEFIIITHKDFLSIAEDYKNYRENSVKNPLKTKVFNVSDIYNEFSSGKLDPLSIRDFLRYAYNTWLIKPKYLLLLGSGNYDYKGNLKGARDKDRQRVPVFETPESLDPIDSYVSDDFLVRFITGRGDGIDYQNDMAYGRIVVSNEEEAKEVIQKIKNYESGKTSDEWRNCVTFVADDGINSKDKNEDQHTRDSETLAENFIPSSFEKKKIFIVEYPTVIKAEGRTKPDANIDIIDRINQGTLIINYMGHGNPKQWAGEAVFTKEFSIPMLINKNKLTFVVAAACDYGRYDKISEICAPEVLIKSSTGGAIGALSASRSVYGNENFNFASSFYQELFNNYPDNKISRIGDVIYNVKQSFSGINDNKFHLQGDPTIRLAAPEYLASIDSVNGIKINAEVKLKSAQKSTIAGRILKEDGSVWKEYNGKISVRLYDSKRAISLEEEGTEFKFTKPGVLLYSGEYSVRNGYFSMSFVLTKDISYENTPGDLKTYFFNENSDGIGYNNQVYFTASDSNNSLDITGPVLNAYINDKNFVNGDLVGKNPKLIIDLYDENGINITGGIGHRFQAWIDENINGIDLGTYYKGEIDNYQSGTAEYPLNDIASGNHKVKVKAFDIFNNSSTSEVRFRVENSLSFSMQNVLNYPNPFSKNTKFTFERADETPINVTIKIYTISGRLIKTINEYSISSRFVQIFWDGRDDDGDEIANGIYLYKIISKTEDGRFTSESLGKLSVVR